jgi:hypothetical protein
MVFSELTMYSRADFYPDGDAVSFNQTIFDKTLAYWPDEILTYVQAEKSRLARFNESRTINPTFSITEKDYLVSQGEVASFLFIFGDKVTGTIKRKYIEYFLSK